MRANKFSIGGLRGVHVSSIVNWGYEDNFKPVYLFFLRKNFNRTKTLTDKKRTNKTKIIEQKQQQRQQFLASTNF